MRKFKTYLIENTEQDHDDNFQMLNDMLHLKLMRLHNVENPSSEGASHPLPVFYTQKGEQRSESGAPSRKYTWNSWGSAVKSLANSITDHHFSEGTLTGSKGTFDLNRGIGNQITKSILQKHQPAISQLKDRHYEFMKSLYENDKSVKGIIQPLIYDHDTDLKTISDIHFTDLLNHHLINSQNEYRTMFDTPYLIPERQDRIISSHNVQVSRHQHPLGYFLNGGTSVFHAAGSDPSSHDNTGKHGPSTIEDITNSGRLVDVTSKFKK